MIKNDQWIRLSTIEKINELPSKKYGVEYVRKISDTRFHASEIYKVEFVRFFNSNINPNEDNVTNLDYEFHRDDGPAIIHLSTYSRGKSHPVDISFIQNGVYYRERWTTNKFVLLTPKG